jgi:hypothetical protein
VILILVTGARTPHPQIIGWRLGHMKKGFSDAYQVLHDAWEKAEKEYSRANQDNHR